MGRPRKYFSEEERKEAHNQANRRYKERNPDKRKASIKLYNETHKVQRAEYNTDYNAKYSLTQKGRANNLLTSYRRSDKKYNRGECTLTADWIVEHIFNQPCHYCGKTDWKELGCDRIDNSLPHTPDNVVPCCYGCNSKRNQKTYDEFIKLLGNTN